MKENNLVVQHNKLIESRYKLSITEQRLIKLLISMIEPQDEDFKQYEIRVSELASLLDIKGGDVYLAIDKAVDRLMDAPIRFYDGNDKVKVRWLSSSRYQRKKGLALLRFDPELKPFLLQLKEQFTSYQLVNIIKLKHIYSIRIYELLKQYERIGRRRFSVEALRSVLMVGEGEYKQYRDFRRWILKVAQKELEEKTDISFEWIEEKTKRTCVAIEFIIKPRKQPEGAVAADIRAAKPEQPETAKEENPAVAQLTALGVARKTAEALARE
jgi:plasmid replication initiation protein